MTEEPRREPSFFQQRPQHRFALEYVLLELRQRRRVQIEMRIRVVPELEAGIEPHFQ